MDTSLIWVFWSCDALSVFVFIDAVLGVEARVLCVLGQHSTNLVSSSACPRCFEGTYLCPECLRDMAAEYERLILTRDTICQQVCLCQQVWLRNRERGGTRHFRNTLSPNDL